MNRVTRDDIIKMAQQTMNRDKLGFWAAGISDLEDFAALVRADEREATINNVLRTINELRPALVLAAFADKDKAWALDKVKESIEKLKEKNT